MCSSDRVGRARSTSACMERGNFAWAPFGKLRKIESCFTARAVAAFIARDLSHHLSSSHEAISGFAYLQTFEVRKKQPRSCSALAAAR